MAETCRTCGRALTATELHYYGHSCEACEGEQMAALEADRDAPCDWFERAVERIKQARTVPGAGAAAASGEEQGNA